LVISAIQPEQRFRHDRADDADRDRERDQEQHPRVRPEIAQPIGLMFLHRSLGHRRHGFQCAKERASRNRCVRQISVAPVSAAGTDIAPLSGGSMDAPLRILTVDNEPSVTLSLKYVFAGPRFEVRSVDNGNAALATLDATPDPYDLIIVDQKMPNLTGLELVGALRQRSVPGKIIVLSADISAEIRAAYERMDVDAIFSKPFDVVELRKAVEHLAT
jgi:CheY-like chemotaxis protein